MSIARKTSILVAMLSVVATTAAAQSADPADSAQTAAAQSQPQPPTAPSTAAPASTPPAAAETPLAPETPAGAAPAAPAGAAPPAPAGAPIVGYTKDTRPADFVLMTTGHALFGAVGALTAMAQGHEMSKQYGLEDSANLITPALAKAYAEAHDYQLAAEPIPVDRAHKYLLKTATKEGADVKDARYVVNAAAGVNAIYFSFDWTHYGLIYNIVAKVVDTSDGKVVAKARCFLRPKKTSDSPTHEQLLADNATVLKKMMADDAQACLSKLEAGLLKP